MVASLKHLRHPLQACWLVLIETLVVAASLFVAKSVFTRTPERYSDGVIYVFWVSVPRMYCLARLRSSSLSILVMNLIAVKLFFVTYVTCCNNYFL